ncbi:MAG: LacI family DNA-binding transcriptional regulator [Clostridia bacterium]|nr:LacI family transcriptional regulator [Clostridiales bacterium]MBQ3505547.1 LacI family DNA-binding transcriptional regulator [Clostridia bacterium]
MSVTIKDVAKCAGVGVGTVSRVLNGGESVNEEKCLRVQEAIKKLNFVPNRMAVRLRKNASGLLALLVPVINHPFFAKFAYFAEDEASKYGYSLLLVSSQHRISKEEEILGRIKRREVDGAIFVTHYEHKEESLKDCPIVSIDRQLGKEIPYVTSDNYEATKKAVEFLIEKGCKKIGYIGSKPLVESEVMKREEAYLDVMKAHGMQPYVMNDVIMHGEENEVVAKFLETYKGMDGVFASGYTMAQVLYETAMQQDINVPNDLQIISYDGAFKQWNNNRLLTCLEQPIEKMAREVVKLLVDKIAGKAVPVRTMFETSFVLGATTK